MFNEEKKPQGEPGLAGKLNDLASNLSELDGLVDQLIITVRGPVPRGDAGGCPLDELEEPENLNVRANDCLRWAARISAALAELKRGLG